MGNKDVHWVTEDCGDTIESIPSINYKGFLFHPTAKNWLLAFSRNQCPLNEKFCTMTKSLFVSFNLGKSWEKLADNIDTYKWYFINIFYVFT